jgi:hypothetical protein
MNLFFDLYLLLSHVIIIPFAWKIDLSQLGKAFDSEQFLLKLHVLRLTGRNES